MMHADLYFFLDKKVAKNNCVEAPAPEFIKGDDYTQVYIYPKRILYK
jgi:hypothetical protein